jgi:hypothetical protein
MNMNAQGASKPATTGCEPCAADPWGPLQVHQWSFIPMNLPNCLMQGEMWYHTKNCGGKIVYEIISQSVTQLSGNCSFPFCANAAFAMDFEREMILNVIGATNVISSIPVACYRQVELDPNSDPNFIDCWTHHGALVYNGNPMTSIPCNTSCCTAEADVQYNGGMPWIKWTPISTPTCINSSPVPSAVSLTVCCETVLNGWGEEVCTNYQVFNLSILDTGDCSAYCSGMLFFRGVATSLKEAEDIIQANIKFQRETKVFPNPSNGRMNLSMTLPTSQPVDVEVLDIKGALVRKFTLPYETAQAEYPYDVSDLKSGLYFVKISTRDFGSKVIKVNKQ